MSRKDPPGARRSLEEVYENTTRSDLVRMAAMCALCRLASLDGKSWSEVKGYVKRTAGTNERLRKQAAELKTKFWANEKETEGE